MNQHQYGIPGTDMKNRAVFILQKRDIELIIGHDQSLLQKDSEMCYLKGIVGMVMRLDQLLYDSYYKIE